MLVEIRAAHAQSRPRSFATFGLGFLRCLVGPGAVDLVSKRRDGEVVTQEVAIRLKRVRIPDIVLESCSAVCRAGQSHGGLAIVRAAIVEDQVHRTALRIDGHPLKELVIAVVNGIVVHPDRLTPAPSMVGGRRYKHVNVAVRVIAPGHVKLAALFTAAGIEADLGKAIGARNAGDAEVSRPGGNDAPIFAEGLAAVMGDGHHDAIAVVPYGIERAVRRDYAVKAFKRAVVVARQSGSAVELYRFGPRLASVCGA